MHPPAYSICNGTIDLQNFSGGYTQDHIKGEGKEREGIYRGGLGKDRNGSKDRELAWVGFGM
jgi:hypothetical protein